jgi:hypothetical protein
MAAGGWICIIEMSTYCASDVVALYIKCERTIYAVCRQECV